LRNVMRDARRRYADGLQLARDSEAICGLPVDFLPTTRSLDTREPPPPAAAAPYKFVFIGRWHRNKGIDLLLDALTLLADADWECIAEVAIYGGGPLQRTVYAKAQSLLDAQRPLTIGGFIPKAMAERAIVNADWVLIPSRIESIPVIFSDAMKLGRPVIAMPVGDLPRLMQNVSCGILASEPTDKALAEAVKRALHSAANEFSIGIDAQARRFDLATIAADITREAFIGE